MKKIDVFIEKKEDLTNKYNSEVLSKEVNNYIEEECLGVKVKENISLNIYTPKDLPTEEKESITKLIHRNYKALYQESIEINNYQNKISIVLSLLGIIFIVISNFLSSEKILSELFEIAGWVALWEVMYKELFEDIKDKMKRQKYKKLSQCKVEYITKKTS